MHRFNGEIAYTIHQTIRTTADRTAKELTKQSVSNLEQALFENSMDEGVLEYDVVLRVFDIEQRHALNNALQEAGIQNLLKIARKFRTLTASIGFASIQIDMSFFRELRRREVFLDGDGLNKLHTPLVCGDVFETEESQKYILLGRVNTN